MIKKRLSTIVVISVVLLIIGVIALFIGGEMAGWDIRAFLVSEKALFIYFLIAVFFCVMAFVMYQMRDK